MVREPGGAIAAERILERVSRLIEFGHVHVDEAAVQMTFGEQHRVTAALPEGEHLVGELASDPILAAQQMK